jgi:hypothetical protein
MATLKSATGAAWSMWVVKVVRCCSCTLPRRWPTAQGCPASFGVLIQPLLPPALLHCLPDYTLRSYQAAFRQLPGLSADVMLPAGAALAADDAPLDKMPQALATLAHAVLLLQPVLSRSDVLGKACSAAVQAASSGWCFGLRGDPASMHQRRVQRAAAAMQQVLQGNAGWQAVPGCAVAVQLFSQVAASAASMKTLDFSLSARGVEVSLSARGVEEGTPTPVVRHLQQQHEMSAQALVLFLARMLVLLLLCRSWSVSATAGGDVSLKPSRPDKQQS